jgi:hypothetical protein
VKNYEFFAAGRVWIVPQFHLVKLPDGIEGASMAEFRRIHLAIAIAICGCTEPLTPAEFEFLCDVADVPYAKVADRIGLNRSALTKWMQKGSPMRSGRSIWLKQWFIVILFKDKIGQHNISVHDLEESGLLLKKLRDEVIRCKAAEVITKATSLKGDS